MVFVPRADVVAKTTGHLLNVPPLPGRAVFLLVGTHADVACNRVSCGISRIFHVASCTRTLMCLCGGIGTNVPQRDETPVWGLVGDVLDRLSLFVSFRLL